MCFFLDGNDNSIQGYNYQQQTPEISYAPSIEVSNIYKEPTNSISEYGAPAVNNVNGNDASTGYNRPSSNYGAPVYSYGTPEPSYGTPSPNYGSPTSNYGPPANSYGPPEPNHHVPAPVYGPPSIPQPAPSYAPVPIYFKPVPYPHYLHDHWPLLAKLKAKLNLFTIGKLLLKLVIFKKVIKFISFICLLLILPKLKNMFKENMSNDNYNSETNNRQLRSKGS